MSLGDTSSLLLADDSTVYALDVLGEEDFVEGLTDFTDLPDIAEGIAAKVLVPLHE
eukprot:CAMPEP_0114576876 /NCGR_PEP_ID=MMETSP0125-20121206/1591_1 /TAXON_ID=485358 ORGANISM="Aristerostoma sp., Strain ATCC 50986" /NCGR_SAMPLE_ID=MMETSP0125 /ASSEMBLY_ACC=CAM_ASM_000245 /LENGTH=55 /DNA_ID=CAMNT_0001765735 /DNA_START=1545 /DNA_END=1712 /DNA_ORIENTATION=+